MSAKAQHAAPPPGWISRAFHSDDALACFHHFKPIVLQIPFEQIVPCRVDTVLGRINIERGVEQFQHHIDALMERAPLTPFDAILELPSLAFGLIHAASRVATPGSEGTIGTLLAELRPLRAQMLTQLETLGARSLVPAHKVAEIRAGSGPIDSARDGVSICALFREHAHALAGKHPFSEEDIARVGTLGSRLLLLLRPPRALAEAPTPNPDALLRDRFYTEVVRRHDALRDAGVAASGWRLLDELYPLLGVQQAVSTNSKAEPETRPETRPDTRPDTAPETKTG